MPYTMIIADDEPKLIRLLKELVDFTELGIEVAAECRDGEEAFQKIVEHEPDIVLSDIKMPVYDGISLIEKTRKQGLNTRFILISGYRHFEFARSAIRLNVVDYLLKPIDAAVLKETLLKACRKVDQMREAQAGNEELKRIRTQQNQSRMDGFWKQLVYQEEGEDPIWSEAACNRDYHTSFQEGCYQVLCIYCNISGLMEQQDSSLIEKMNAVIDKTLREVSRVYYHITTYQGYVLVLNFEEKQKKLVREAMVALYYSVRDLREFYGDFELIVGCSRMKGAIRELKSAFREAHYAQWGRMVLTGSFIIEYNQIANLKRFATTELPDDAQCTKISECIKYLREEELGEIFHELSAGAAAKSNSYPGDMSRAFNRLKAAVMESSDRPESRKLLEEECFYAYIESRSFPKLFQKMFLCLEKYILEEKKKMREKLGKPISEAVCYMKKNYNRDISLEEVAKAGNVSAGYLSKLFKTEMQVGFLEYLTQLRLKESEKLLAQSSLSIKEIALSVGYPDEKYYSKLFKKTTGIKPSEYRKIYN